MYNDKQWFGDVGLLSVGAIAVGVVLTNYLGELNTATRLTIILMVFMLLIFRALKITLITLIPIMIVTGFMLTQVLTVYSNSLGLVQFTIAFLIALDLLFIASGLSRKVDKKYFNKKRTINILVSLVILVVISIVFPPMMPALVVLLLLSTLLFLVLLLSSDMRDVRILAKSKSDITSFVAIMIITFACITAYTLEVLVLAKEWVNM